MDSSDAAASLDKASLRATAATGSLRGRPIHALASGMPPRSSSKLWTIRVDPRAALAMVLAISISAYSVALTGNSASFWGTTMVTKST
ncbi:hypothetical protein LP414_07955 [Polaromonas sp. P1(28)-13]|nr:hypothetical protein LP414_07955 [Polaromonas sp. P1(28)-13]